MPEPANDEANSGLWVWEGAPLQSATVPALPLWVFLVIITLTTAVAGLSLGLGMLAFRELYAAPAPAPLPLSEAQRAALFQDFQAHLKATGH